MKKQTNKLSFWLVGCLVMLGLSFAACNPGGDDNPTLTPEQQQQAYQPVSYTHLTLPTIYSV